VSVYGTAPPGLLPLTRERDESGTREETKQRAANSAFPFDRSRRPPPRSSWLVADQTASTTPWGPPRTTSSSSPAPDPIPRMASPSPREGGHGSYHPTRLALAPSTAWSGTESSSEEPKYSYGGGAGAGGAAGRRAGLPGLAAGGSSSSGGDEEREVLQRPLRRYSEGRPRAGTLLPTAAQLAYSSAGAHSSLASTSADPRPYAPPVPPPRRSIEAVRSQRTSRRASILAEPRAGTSSRAANDGVEHEGGDRMLEGVHDRKGKAKERPVSRSYGSPITNDPLDLLSSLQIPSLPTIDSSRTSSPASSPNRSQLHEHRRSSVRIPADPSTFSFASSSSTPSNTAADPPPQTLQQLLANVDLSAALRLVQTVQNQQKAPPPPLPAPVPPPEPIYPTTPPPVNARLSRNVVRSASTSRSFSFGSSDVQRPLLADVRPSPASSQAGSQIKMDTKAIAAPGSGNARRRGLSLGFGGGLVPGRSRGLSELAMKREPTEEASKSTLRVPDERAVMGEEARIFEGESSIQPSPYSSLTLDVPLQNKSPECISLSRLRHFDDLRTAPSTSPSATPPSSTPSPSTFPLPLPSPSLTGDAIGKKSSVDGGARESERVSEGKHWGVKRMSVLATPVLLRRKVDRRTMGTGWRRLRRSQRSCRPMDRGGTSIPDRGRSTLTMSSSTTRQEGRWTRRDSRRRRERYRDWDWVFETSLA
jgi:hypothetical protein